MAFLLGKFNYLVFYGRTISWSNSLNATRVHCTLHQILSNKNEIDFLEVTADHFLSSTEHRKKFLDKLSSEYVLIPHGLNLSLGSAEGLNNEYLKDLSGLVKYLSPPWWSEHIAFTKAGDIEIGHLSPLPFNNESLSALCENIRIAREEIDVPLILENITYNVDLPWNNIEESKYLAELINRANCGLLLDVTNLYINSHNHKYDPIDFLNNIPPDSITQLHFVGGIEKDGKWIDSHGHNTQDEIFDLIEEVLKYASVKGVILERDANFPEFDVLIDELDRVRRLGRKYGRWD